MAEKEPIKKVLIIGVLVLNFNAQKKASMKNLYEESTEQKMQTYFRGLWEKEARHYASGDPKV